LAAVERRRVAEVGFHAGRAGTRREAPAGHELPAIARGQAEAADLEAAAEFGAEVGGVGALELARIEIDRLQLDRIVDAPAAGELPEAAGMIARVGREAVGPAVVGAGADADAEVGRAGGE